MAAYFGRKRHLPGEGDRVHAGRGSPRPLSPVRKLRRLLPQRRRHGIYAPHAVRHDQRRRAGAVLAANTMWACVSCYLCTTRCPQNIPITDIMYALKRISIAEQRYKNTDAPALAKTFTDFVDKYGRSFEFGLATGYHLLNRPLSMMKMGPMGLQMFTRGRMALLPTKIRQIDQLQAIIRKAKELSAK